MSRTNLFNFSKLDQINLMGSNNGCAVYRVRNPSSAYFDALKVITIDPEEEFSRCEILHEMELFQDLNHPNIVKCHNIMDSNGEDIQVLLEFMNGGSLADRHITSEGHLSNIASQILSGIAYITTSNHPIFWLIMHKIASRLQILAWAKFFHNFWTQKILLEPSGTRVLKG